jgi:hypothetical protein
MKFAEYRPLALRTAKRFPSLREDFEHAALGLSTEIGEVNTEVKRVVIYGKVMTEEMRLHTLEELGDTLAHAIDELDQEQDESLMDLFKPISGDLKKCGLFLASLGGAVAMASTIPEDDYGTRSQRDQIRSVLSAIVFVVDHMSVMLGSTGNLTRSENIAKLRLRFADQYSDLAAEARADKGGLPATQS